MPNYSKIAGPLAELLSKLPAGSRAAQEAIAAEMAARKAAQEAAYAAHTLPTEKGKKTIAKTKKMLGKEDEAVQAPSVIIPSKVSNVEQAIRQSKGEYGAKRVQRAADQVKNLEHQYTEEALRQAFGGDNAAAMMVANPAEFQKYAARLSDPYRAAMESYIQKMSPGGGGASDVPFLELNKNKGKLPFVSGHEGRHRNVALEELGDESTLWRMLPRANLREPFPRRSQEDYLQALIEQIGDEPLVIPEERFTNKEDRIPDWTKARKLPPLFAEGGLAEGGVPEKRDVSQLFPLKWSADANLHKGRTGVWTDTNDVFTGAMRGLGETLLGAGRGAASTTLGGVQDLINMVDIPKIMTGESYQIPYGSEYFKENLPFKPTTQTGEVAQELGSFLPVDPVSAFKSGVSTVKKVGKAIAPTAAEMALDLAEKAGTPVRQFAIPPEGKLSKEEYSRMMREKYAAENAAKMAKKEAAPVTMADLKPKEEKVAADSLGFYSPTEKAAANLKRNIADGELMLSDLKKFPDVTPDELAMTGLEEWLKGKKTVTKQQVKDYMAKNRLEIEEVKYEQGKGNADEMKFDSGEVIDDYEYINSRADDIAYDWDHIGHESKDEIRARILEKYDPEEAEQLLASGKIDDLVEEEVGKLANQYANDEYYENPYRRYRNDMGYEIVGNDDVGYHVTDPRGDHIRMNREAYDVETAEGYARDHAMESGYIDEGETKFHDYQLPGGENYREILLKTPSKKQRFEEEIRELEHSMENPGNDPRELREMQKELDKLKADYKYAENNDYESSHWDEPNVIAHLRLQDRVDSEGNKILYVDEMQSDWHQEGRRQGYKDPERMKQADALRPQKQKLQQEFDLLSKKMLDYDMQFTETNGLQKASQDEVNRLLRNDPGYLELKNKSIKASNDISDLTKQITALTSGVPKGPFADNWHKLALKRVMKYAADNGYTRVGFSKSQPQVNRWGTDVVAWDKTDVVDPKLAEELGIPPTGWTVTATEQRGGRAGNMALEDEARARGILQENRATTVQDRNQLYAVVAKIGRGKTEQELQKLTDRIWKQMQEKDAGFVAPREAGMKKFYDEELEGALKKYANQFKGKYGQTTLDVPREGKQTINYIDITPSLKKSTTKGQPYKAGGAVHMAEGGAVKNNEVFSLDELINNALMSSEVKMADGGVFDLNNLMSEAMVKNQPNDVGYLLSNAMSQHFADGGAANTIGPNMSNISQSISRILQRKNYA